MVDGQESLQLTDLSKNAEVLATQPAYYRYSQLEIAREMKEEFLLVADDVLESASKSIDQSRVGTHELPDGSKLQLSGFERMAIAE